jgi:hypothetical protein
VHRAVETGDHLFPFLQLVVHPQNLSGRITLRWFLLQFHQFHPEDGRRSVLLSDAEVGVRHKQHLLLFLVFAVLTDLPSGKALNLQNCADWGVLGEITGFFLTHRCGKELFGNIELPLFSL